MQDKRRIAFLGAGNMATALISGLIQSGYPAELVTAVNRTPEKNRVLETRFGIQTSIDPKQAAEQAEVIVLGVKPQVMGDLIGQLEGIDWSKKLMLSIAAGITLARFQQWFQKHIQLIRIMPNTPCLIGQGMSGLFAPAHIHEKDKTYTSALMQAVGEIVWVEKESQINGIIAAAGSAPAYFFYFMEAMQTECIRQGFSPETAKALVQQAALGAASLVKANPELSLSTLREQVTSKGGTTAKAIETFEQRQVFDTVSAAMQAAVQRAEEMETLL